MLVTLILTWVAKDLLDYSDRNTDHLNLNAGHSEDLLDYSDHNTNTHSGHLNFNVGHFKDL